MYIYIYIGVSQYTNVTLAWNTHISNLEDSHGDLIFHISVVYGTIVAMLLAFKTLFWKLESTSNDEDDKNNEKKNNTQKGDSRIQVSSLNSRRLLRNDIVSQSPSRGQSTSPRQELTSHHHTIATSIKQYLYKNYIDRIFVGVFSDLSLGTLRFHLAIYPIYVLIHTYIHTYTYKPFYLCAYK